jgi:hypothetical protein
MRAILQQIAYPSPLKVHVIRVVLLWALAMTSAIRRDDAPASRRQILLRRKMISAA